MDGTANNHSPTTRINFATFRFLYSMLQIIGAIMIILMACWIFIYRGGLSWSLSPSVQFNWHPLLMTIGMIFLYGNSILVYRGFRYTSKKSLKLSHASIFGTIMVLVLMASLAVYDSHVLASPPIPNFYSLHSWVGITAVMLFVFQWIGGFVSFLVPILAAPRRQAIMPFHIFFGLTGYVLAVVAALMGLSEKAFFVLGPKSETPYSEFPSEGLLINFIGLSFVIFGGLVVYLAQHKNYKRIPLPEDAVLLARQNETSPSLDEKRYGTDLTNDG